MSTSTLKSAEELMNAVESFPSLPHAVLDIIRSLDDESLKLEQLARKIESDLGMLAGVLKLVNSPRYGAKGSVASTQQAVMILGFNAVRNLACLGGVSSHFENNCRDLFDFKKFMRHSIGVACCAKSIAKRTRLNPDAAFVSGLLHDVGQLVAAVTLSEELREVMDYKRRHDCHVALAERAVLGIDHAQIGAHLANRWNFPPVIGEAIGSHHQVFEMGGSRMADVVHVAEVLSHALDFGGSGQVPPLCHDAMIRLDLSFHDMRTHFDEIEEECSDFVQMLGVD